MSLPKTLYIGPFIQCESLNKLDICPNGMIGVDEKGLIVFIVRSIKGQQIPIEGEWEKAKVVRIEGPGFFFPGFIGTEHLDIIIVNEIEVRLTRVQIHTPTHHNILTPASSGRAPYWTGSTHTPFPPKPRSQIYHKQLEFTTESSPGLSPTEQQRHVTTLQITSQPPICSQTYASRKASEL